MSGVVKTIKKVVKGVVKAVVGVVKAVVGVVSSIINFVAQPFLGLLGGAPSIPDASAEAERQQGVLITRQGSTVQIPVVYGYRQVGGAITYAETGADNNRYLWVAYVLSEGTVEGLHQLFIDDNPLPDDIIPLLNNGQTVDIGTGKYKDRCKLQFSHGIFNSSPSSSTMGTHSILKDAPSWKSSMVYNGCAVLFARYEWKKIETQEDADANPYSGNIPAIKATLMGKKIASLTISNPDTYSYDGAPTRYSTNPAEVLLDYLRNPRYGKGLKNTDIDWDSFKTAAAKCNQTVEHISGINGKILTCNAVVDTGQTLFANTKNLLMGFRAYMPYSQGKYKLRIEDAGNATDITSGVATIVQTFNEDNIQGAVTFSAVERTSKYNQVQINYVDPDKKFSVESVIYPETDSERQTYIDNDGGRVNKLEATFPTITNYAMAKDFARLLFNKSRFQESVSFTASSQAIELEVGDNIYIQSKMLNFGSTPFRVVSMRINNDMTVELGCIKNDDSIYPHTRVGEEDIVLPPYIPRGATISYPVTIGGTPIGIVPPVGAPVPIVNFPPRIFNIDPVEVDSAGYTTVTVNGADFQDGITAQWIGTDGTIYTPDSAGGSEVEFVSSTQIKFETLTAMDENNSPYDLKVINPSSAGSLTARINNVLAVEEATPQPTPDPDPPIQDPPDVLPPEDPVITPDPTPPPPEGPGDNDPPPPPPPPVLEFNNVVEFPLVKYRTVGDLVYADITAIQPDRQDYKELKVYFKRSIASETVYSQQTVTTIPGANKSFQFTIGPLLAGSTYILLARVKYQTGESSTQITRINLNAVGSVAQEDPVDYFQQASTGWPADPGTPVKVFNNKIANITGQTLLTGGQPKDPKEIRFTVTQDINNQPVNFDVSGVVVYYKTSAATQWNKRFHAFPTTYVPGTSQNFTINYVGSPVYPSVPTANQQNYDFIFRFTYKDGKESSEQIRVEGVNTERSGLGLYDYDPLYGEYLYKEKATAFDIEMVDPSAPSAASSMTIELDQITNTFNGPDNIQFYIKPPDASVLADWRGVRIRYRKVVPGTDPDFETYTSTSTGINAISGLHFLPLQIDFGDTYEFVLTPMYANSGVRTDSTESLFGVGYVHKSQIRDDYPPTGNWLQSFNFVPMKTKLALKTIDEAFPAPPNPLVDIVEWKVQSPKSQANHFQNHYKLTFNTHAVSGITAVNVYRRYFAPGNGYFSPVATENLYGIGRWEKIAVTSFESSPDSTTVFLRPPLTYQEFNPYYVTGGTQSKYYGNGLALKNIEALGTREFHEFLVVAVDGSGEATSGWLLLGGPGSPFRSEVDLLLSVRPQEVDLADFEGYTSDYDRNLSQAITRIPIADVKYNYRSSYSAVVPTTTPPIE